MTTTTASLSSEGARMSTFSQITLSLFWLGVSAHWTIILITTLPAQAEMIGGAAVRGQTLGTVLAIGAFLSMIVAPIFGALSDRIVTPFGRRRPWIVLGTVMNLLGLYGLATFARANDMSSLPLYIAAFLWVQFWNNVATAPYSALIPDTVPRAQRGSASGWYGLMTILGTLIAALAPIYFTTADGTTDITALYLFTGGVLLFGMLGTVIFVHEPPVTRKPPPFVLVEFLKGLIEPLKDNDFRWVFMTRFLMVMGVYSIQPFLLFYMGSVVREFNLFNALTARNAIEAVSVFLLMFLVGALPSSIIAGILSDRYGRKIMVYISSACQAAVPIVFILFAPNFSITALLGLIFGIGYGAYQSVDWAMASEVLPSEDDYAKDMGVWHIAMTLPQVLATLMAGFLLDYFNNARPTAQGEPGTFGFTVIFAFAALYFILGTVLVRKIRKVR